MANRAPANTTTFVQLTLSDLDQRALRVLWAIKIKTPLPDVGLPELKQLFRKGIMRQDYDILGKRDVVLLTGLGKRCIELMHDPDPPTTDMLCECRHAYASHNELNPFVHPKTGGKCLSPGCQCKQYTQATPPPRKGPQGGKPARKLKVA